MSQNSYVIANGSGSSVRSALNNALDSLATTFKGTSRPSGVQAGQPWIDGDTPSSSVWSLYYYDGAHDIKVGEMDSSTGYFMPFINGVALNSVWAQLGVAQTFTAAQRGALSTLTDGSTITPDFSLANNFKVQLAGNRTLANPTNLVAGQDGSIRIRQDATGSRTLAYAWGWTFAGGTAPTLSTAGGTADDLYYSVKVAQSATVTMTIASPGVVTYTGHGLVTGQQIQLTTTGALPTGLSASTTYYVVYIDANSFSLATSLANAAAGTKINTSGSQSGTHTLTAVSIAANLTKAVA